MKDHESMAKKMMYRVPLTWISIGVMLLGVASYAYAGKKKKAPNIDEANWRQAHAGKSTLADHAHIDTSQLVWPQPPAIARIRYTREVFRELKPTDSPSGAPVVTVEKKKQSWMDRMAGVQTTDNGARKVQRDHWLGKPYGIGVDSKGRVYVADTFVSAVFIFDLEQKTTQLLRNGVEAHWDTITGLTVDDADRVFVVDSGKHRVAAFGKNLKLEAYFGDDQLKTPTGIAVDPENRLIYVVDTEKENVAVFDADTFKFLRTIGRPMKDVSDDAPGAMAKPTNVTVDNKALVYVSDTLNNRIQVFDADGNFIRMWGKAGDVAGYFARPKGLSIDVDGHIWVADAFLNYVQIFDQEGHLLGYLGGGGTYPGQFSVPADVFVDQKTNRVFVTDQFPGRLQVFRYVTDEEAKVLKDEHDKKKGGSSPETKSSASPEAQTTNAKVQSEKPRQ
jgi:DNA-binding beta-propeller fold protein YncE